MEKIFCSLILLTLLQYTFTYPAEELSLGSRRARKDAVLYIIGGTLAEPSEFPHLAAIGFMRSFIKHWLCGGTLINKRFVLTAAHCLENMDDRQYGKAVMVRLGDLDLKDSSDDEFAQEISVIQRMRHPNYTYPMKYNDIGLLKLKEDAVFNKFVRPACLHRTYDIMAMQAQVVGWGRTEKGNAAPGRKLYKVNVDLHHIDKCTRIVNRTDILVRNMALMENLLDEAMICAGVLSGGKGECNGDSGGPLQIKSTSPECSAEIIGIVSFGLGNCGAPNTPAVYVRVSHYIPWIESIINSSN